MNSNSEQNVQIIYVYSTAIVINGPCTDSSSLDIWEEIICFTIESNLKKKKGIGNFEGQVVLLLA